jgi:hypothetical protein
MPVMIVKWHFVRADKNCEELHFLKLKSSRVFMVCIGNSEFYHESNGTMKERQKFMKNMNTRKKAVTMREIEI